MVKYTFGAGLSQSVLLVVDKNMNIRPQVQVGRNHKDGRLTNFKSLKRAGEVLRAARKAGALSS